MVSPTNPTLQALFLRLEAAGINFSLGPSIIDDAAITGKFSSLLLAQNGAVPVANAAVASEADSVTLTCDALLFGRAASGATFTFTIDEGVLRLILTATLGNLTVADIYNAKILPASSYEIAQWGANLAPLIDVTVTFDSNGAGRVDFGSDDAGVSWNVLDIAGVSLSAPQAAISLLGEGPSLPASIQPRVETGISISAQTTIPVYLDLPIGLQGWSIGLDAGENGLQLGSLDVINPLTGGAHSGLPSGVIALDQFWLTGLSIDFPPVDQNVWRFNMGLRIGEPTGERPAWPAIPGVIEVKTITADIRLLMFTPEGGSLTTVPTGSFSGTIKIANNPVDIAIDVPVGPDGWRLANGAPIELVGSLSDLKQFLSNNSTILAETLAPLGTAQSVAIDTIEVYFNPDAKTISRAQFSLEILDWSPAISWLKIDEISLGFDIEKPLDVSGKRKIDTYLKARMTIGPVYADMAATVASDGLVTIEAMAALHLMKLSDLPADVITPAQMTPALPTGLPLDGDVNLNQLFVQHDTSASYFPEVFVDVEANLAWRLPGDVFSLWDVSFALDFVKENASADAVVTGSIGATVSLGGIPFALSATKLEPTDPWAFAGWLEGPQTIDFAALFQETVSSDLKLPTVAGFPPSLTITRAEAHLIPDTGKFDFTGAAFATWPIDFAKGSFSVLQLGGEVHIPETGGGPSTVLVTGNFQLDSLNARASLLVGTENAPTIIQIAVKDVAALSPKNVVNELLSTDNQDVYGSVPRPSDFTNPGFFAAAVKINLTTESFLVSGEYAAPGDNALYGAVALLVEKTSPLTTRPSEDTLAPANANDQWGFIFAAALKNWSFDKISGPLSVVSSIISVDVAKAGVALSLLDEKAGAEIAQAVPAIPAAVDIKPGLNFFAELTFTGGLMVDIATILGVEGKGPYTLAGHIPRDAGTSIFTAKLETLTLLGFLEFNNIVFTYAVDNEAGREVTLDGTITVKVGAQSPQFTGGVLVNDTQASFSIKTAQPLNNPLGMPGIDLLDIKFEFTNVFATDHDPAQLTMSLTGDVEFAAGISLQGKIVFHQQETALVLVGITKPLSIDAIFQKYLGRIWPTGLLDITFTTGDLYYAPAAITIHGTDYKQGLHIDSTVDIYFLKGCGLRVDIDDQRSITATGVWPNNIDWKFINFFDPENPAKGPTANINSQSNAFTLACAFDLFGVRIADTAQIVIGNHAMSGSVTFAAPLGPFGSPRIDFTWDDDGFHVAGFGVPDGSLPQIILDAANFITQDPPQCPVDFIEKLALSTKIDVSSDFSISMEPIQGGGSAPFVNITLKGVLKLVTNSQIYDGDILEANLADATLKLPFPGTGGFTWGDLADHFVETIKEAAQSTFHNFIEDPKNLAKLLAAKGVEFTVQKLIDYLVCKETPAAEAEAFAEAAVSAEAAEVVIGGVAIGVGGVVGAVVGGVFTNNPGGGDPQKPKPGTPGAPTHIRYANGQLTVSWSGVDHANIYSVVYTENGGSAKSSPSTSGTTINIPAPSGPNFACRIVAAGDGGVSPPGPAASLQTVGAPTCVALRFEDPVMHVSWNPMPHATSYSLAVTQNGEPLNPPPVITHTPSATSATIAAEQFEAGGAFAVAVAAHAPNADGPASATTLTIQEWPAPQALTLGLDGNAVTATWTTSVASPFNFLLVVLDLGGAPISPQPTIQVTTEQGGGSAKIYGAPLSVGETYQIKVKVLKENGVGAFSAPVSIIYNPVAAPTEFAVAFDLVARTIAGFWQAPEQGDLTYELIATAANKKIPVNQKPAVSGTYYPAAALQDGATYEVKARAWRDTTPGVWTAPIALSLEALGAPAISAVTNQADTVTVVGAATPPANAYEAEILDASGAPLSPPLFVQGASPSITLPATRIVAGTAYQARLRAVIVTESDGTEMKGVSPMTNPAAGTASVFGAYSAPTPFTRKVLPTPTEVSVAYHVPEKKITVFWTNIADPDATYQIQISDGQGVPSIINPAVSGTAYDADLTVGTAYTVQVQALKDGDSSAWTSPVGLTPVDIAAPTITAVTNQAATVTVTCQALPEGATALAGYIQTTESANVASARGAAGSLSVAIDASGLTEETSYQAIAAGIAVQGGAKIIGAPSR